MANYAATVSVLSTLNTRHLYKSHLIHNSSPPTRLIPPTCSPHQILPTRTPSTPCREVGHRRATHKTPAVGVTGHAQSPRIRANCTQPATAQAITHFRVLLLLPPPRLCTITIHRRIQLLTPLTDRWKCMLRIFITRLRLAIPLLEALTSNLLFQVKIKLRYARMLA